MAFLSNIKRYTKDLLNYAPTATAKQNPTKPVMLVLLVYALEQIITTKTFYSCPKTDHRVYGCLFLFGPAAISFVLTLLLNKSFFDSVTGCYKGKFAHGYVCRRTMEAVKRSTFIAFVWLVLAFANTQFYVCICVGPEPSQALLKKMSPEEQVKTQKNISKAKFLSTLISWCLFLCAMAFAFFYIIIRRCCLSDAQGSLPSLQDYEKLESEAAVAEFKEQIKILAKKEGQKQVNESIQKATEEGKSMSEVVSETKEWLENKYPRMMGDLDKKIRTKLALDKNGSSPRNDTYQRVNMNERETNL